MTGRVRSCSFSTWCMNIRIPASRRWRRIALGSSELILNNWSIYHGYYSLGGKTAPSVRKGKYPQSCREIASQKRAEERPFSGRRREGGSQVGVLGNRQGGETRHHQGQHRRSV